MSSTIQFLLIFCPILVMILLFVNWLFSVAKPDSEKNSAFECGLMAINGQPRAEFHVDYYLIAVLFIVFDVEILLFAPYIISLNSIGFYGYAISTIFFTVLGFGFFFEIAKGALNFGYTRIKDTLSKPWNITLTIERKNEITASL